MATNWETDEYGDPLEVGSNPLFPADSKPVIIDRETDKEHNNYIQDYHNEVNTTNIRLQILEIESYLNDHFIDRTEEIHTLILAILSRQHILLLGRPGVAKTNMVTAISHLFNVSFFRRLVNQFTSPDELFGPTSIKAIKEDINRRNLKGKAGDSDLVLLDEVFKGGPSILNTLLALMEERVIDNSDKQGNDQLVNAPLMSLIGTSNEVPARDEGLEAFYDRFLIKLMIQPLKTEADISRLLSLQPMDYENAPTISREDLVVAQTTISSMSLPQSVIKSMLVLWEGLRDNEIWVSDRRFKTSVTVMAADSWLKGYSDINIDSLRILANIFWTESEHMLEVKKLVISSLNPDESIAADIKLAAIEAMDSITPDSDQGDVLQIADQMKTMLQQLEKFESTSVIATIITDVRAYEQSCFQQVTKNRYQPS